MPVRAEQAESLLAGLDASAPAAAAIEDAAAAAAAVAAPVADANGSIEYKRHLVRVLVGRCLREAIGEARRA